MGSKGTGLARERLGLSDVAWAKLGLLSKSSAGDFHAGFLPLIRPSVSSVASSDAEATSSGDPVAEQSCVKG